MLQPVTKQQELEDMMSGKTNWKTVLERFAVLILAVIVIVLAMSVGVQRNDLYSSAAECSSGWYYIDNGKKIEITLPCSVEYKADYLTICNDTLALKGSGMALRVRAAVYDAKITVGDTVVYEYDDSEFPRNDQMKLKLNCIARIPADIPQDASVSIVLKNNGTGKFRIPMVYMETESTAIINEWIGSMPTLIAASIMVMLGVCAFIIHKYLKRNKVTDVRFFYIALFLIICAVWCILDSPIVQGLSTGAPAAGVISFYAFMLLAVPIVKFLKNTANMRRLYILDVCEACFYVNAIVQGIINYFIGIPLKDMLWVEHVLLIVSITAASVMLVKEYRITKDRNLKLILSAFCVLAGSGVLAILLYWLFEFIHYGILFVAGILAFVTMLLAGILSNAIDNMRFRTETLIYQRLSQEDTMTGLGNRSAFDEQMQKIKMTVGNYENVALIFMTPNRLKYINDFFGYDVGDELVIAAASCINLAYGKIGQCYRIDGDEFCAVITNPAETVEELFARLDRQIERINAEKRQYKLAIARGCSLLREPDGNIKSFSDWKYEADRNMYRNKEGGGI